MTAPWVRTLVGPTRGRARAARRGACGWTRAAVGDEEDVGQDAGEGGARGCATWTRGAGGAVSGSIGAPPAQGRPGPAGATACDAADEERRRVPVAVVVAVGDTPGPSSCGGARVVVDVLVRVPMAVIVGRVVVVVRVPVRQDCERLGEVDVRQGSAVVVVPDEPRSGAEGPQRVGSGREEGGERMPSHRAARAHAILRPTMTTGGRGLLDVPRRRGIRRAAGPRRRKYGRLRPRGLRRALAGARPDRHRLGRRARATRCPPRRCGRSATCRTSRATRSSTCGRCSSTRAIDDPEVATFLACWLYEETFHGRALARFLEAAGRRDGERRAALARAARRARSRRSRTALLARAWPDFVAVHMTWGAINELTTLTGYQRLAAVAGHPVLARAPRAHHARRVAPLLLLLPAGRAAAARGPRAARVARALVDRFWAPVGSGVQPAAETRFLATYLFAGAEGRAAARRVDETIRRLPGFADVRAPRGVDRPVRGPARSRGARRRRSRPRDGLDGLALGAARSRVAGGTDGDTRIPACAIASGTAPERIGWLRAAVLGANDGIVSTASLVVGVAAAARDAGTTC